MLPTLLLRIQFQLYLWYIVTYPGQVWEMRMADIGRYVLMLPARSKYPGTYQVTCERLVHVRT